MIYRCISMQISVNLFIISIICLLYTVCSLSHHVFINFSQFHLLKHQPQPLQPHHLLISISFTQTQNPPFPQILPTTHSSPPIILHLPSRTVNCSVVFYQFFCILLSFSVFLVSISHTKLTSCQILIACQNILHFI